MNDLAKLYQKSPSAESLLTRDDDLHWSKIFPWGRGESFKLVTQIQASLSGIPWIKQFTRIYGPAILMPLALLEKGLGFGVRALKGKRFSTHLFQAPGFYSAQTCYEEPFKFGTPIMVVEGVLDAEVASLAYPWVLATLTSKISEAQVFLLSMLTRTIVVSFDNDPAGEKGLRFSTGYLRKWGLQWVDLSPPRRMKDWGDLLSLPREEMQGELVRFQRTLKMKGVL